MTTINLHIERLVLDGLPMAAHEGPLVRAAVEAELFRLLTEGSLRGHLPNAGSAPVVQGSAIPDPAGGGARLGVQIGQAIYGGLR